MKLKQYGGEGTKSYSGKKTNMKYPQHGGEGTALGKKSDIKFHKSDCGPGKYLGKQLGCQGPHQAAGSAAAW